MGSQAPPTSPHTSPSQSPGDPGPAPVPLGWWESKDIWLGLIDEGGGSHRAPRLLFAEHTDSSPLTSCCPPRLLSLTATTPPPAARGWPWSWRELVPQLLGKRENQDPKCFSTPWEPGGPWAWAPENPLQDSTFPATSSDSSPPPAQRSLLSMLPPTLGAYPSQSPASRPPCGISRSLPADLETFPGGRGCPLVAIPRTAP